MELFFIVVFLYVRKLKSEKIQKAAEAAASRVKEALPIESVAETARNLAPTLIK